MPIMNKYTIKFLIGMTIAAVSYSIGYNKGFDDARKTDIKIGTPLFLSLLLK